MADIFTDALHKANINAEIISGQIGFDETADVLEKGKRASVGEIRDWKGGKFQKTATGWKPVSFPKSKADLEEKDVESIKNGSVTKEELDALPEGTEIHFDDNRSYYRKDNEGWVYGNSILGYEHRSGVDGVLETIKMRMESNSWDSSSKYGLKKVLIPKESGKKEEKSLFNKIQAGDSIQIMGTKFEVVGRNADNSIKLKAENGIEVFVDKENFDKLGVKSKAEMQAETKNDETISIDELRSMPTGSEISFNADVNDRGEIKKYRYTLVKDKNGKWSGRGEENGVYGGTIYFDNDNELVSYLNNKDSGELDFTKDVATEEAGNVLNSLDSIKQMDEKQLKQTFPYLSSLPKEGVNWGDREKLASKNIKTLIKRLFPNVEGLSVRKRDYDSILVEMDNKVPNGVRQIADLFDESYKQNPYDDGFESKSTNFTNTFGGAKYIFVQRSY